MFIQPCLNAFLYIIHTYECACINVLAHACTRIPAETPRYAAAVKGHSKCAVNNKTHHFLIN